MIGWNDLTDDGKALVSLLILIAEALLLWG